MGRARPWALVPQDVRDIGEPGTVASVIARMESILGPLPETDGVACFTLLYLDVTKAVGAELKNATFADPGFLLSFGATFGILTAVPRLLESLRHLPRGLRLAAGVLAATVAAEMVLLPIGAAIFSRVTVNGLLLNFAAIPLMTATYSWYSEALSITEG